jgi:hypothetical protein
MISHSLQFMNRLETSNMKTKHNNTETKTQQNKRKHVCMEPRRVFSCSGATAEDFEWGCAHWDGATL